MKKPSRRLSSMLVYTVVNATILYLVSIFDIGFKIIDSDYSIYLTFAVLGVVFGIINSTVETVKAMLSVVTTPAKYLTFGLSSFAINLLILVLFESIVNYLDIGITITLGTIGDIIILSIILTIVYLITKRII